MPYLGNTPSTSFATIVKDTFNGGSTGYTLSKVATTNSVSVFVENVRQEPTSAYSVSGTTLTFTATTPSGTGNIYVLHMNPTTTTTHPAAQNLTAVNGTLTGTLGVTGATTLSGGVSGDVAFDTSTLKIDSSNNRVGIGTTSPSDTLHVKGLAQIESNAGDAAYLRFDNDVNSGGKIWRAGAGVSAHGTFSIYNQTDNKFGVTVTSDGYVTKPQQVYVQAKGNSTRHNQTSANTEQSLDFTEVTDNTNSFAISGGIFTAPVAGRYFIHYYTSQKSNTSYINLILKHNSTTIVRDYNELPNISADWVSQQVTAILNLGASDTVQPFMVSGGTNAYSLENEYRGCSIYLLG